MFAAASNLSIVSPPESLPRDRNGSREIAQLRTKIARKRANDADVLAEVRPVVLTMVQVEEARAGGRMLAYDAVGRSLGETGAWVRKLLGAQGALVRASTYKNIAAAYLDICCRLEAAAADKQAQAAALKLRADEIEAHFARLTCDHKGGTADAPALLAD